MNNKSLAIDTNKIVIKLFILVIFLIISGYSYSSTQPCVKIKSEQSLQLIGKDLCYFKDTSANLGINEILYSGYQNKFKEYHKDVFNKPGTPSAYWFKFQVSNNLPEDLWLEVGSTYAWYIDFYAPDSLNHYSSVIKTGTLRPDSSKFYDVNLFWLPLNKANDTIAKTYYLKVKSGLAVELPMHVGTTKALYKNKTTNDFITAGYVGLMIIIFLYNLFIYVSIRSKIYLYYLAYIFIMLFSLPYSNNYPFIQEIHFWFFNKAWWQENFLFWHMFAYYFIGEFCISYLNLTERSRIFTRIIRFESLILSGIFPLLTLFGFSFVRLVSFAEISIMIFYLTCIVTGYYFTFKKVKQAYIFTMGWTFMVLGVFIFFAVINGFLPYNPITRNVGYFGSAIEVWMFSLALGNRLNILQKEKELMHRENIELINRQNILLEQKVTERTLELERTNYELTESNLELKNTTKKLDSQREKLKQLNLNKDRLLAIVGHDLRSPLVSLINLLDLAKQNQIDPKKVNKILTHLKDDAEHLHFGLDNLLKWALSQMQGLKINTEKVDLYKLVNENMEFFRGYAKSKKITMLNFVNPEIEIHTDKDFIQLVIRNLLNNAIKFSNNNAEVTISCFRNNEGCDIVIADTGIGLSKEQVDALFVSENIKSTVGTSGEKGTGLGLMICKEFVEKSNGKIWVESILGKGSNFHVTFPCNS